jgi:hypothetical protein
VSVGSGIAVLVGVGGMESGISAWIVAVKVGSGVRVGGRLASSGADRNGKDPQARVIKISSVLKMPQGRID